MKSPCRLAIIAAVPALAILASPALAQSGGAKEYTESGAPLLRAGIGFFDVGSNNSFIDSVIDASGAKTSGIALQLGYSFFRPRRHEALVILQNAFETRDLNNILKITAEYRWRFGPQGRVYYGIGLGFGSAGSETVPLGTSVIGYDFGKSGYVELRGHVDDDDTTVSSIVVGARF